MRRALGTDTGGSIRLPASYCGVVGYKPSYGLISRHGVVSFADSLDCVGILAKDVATVQRLNSVISAFDPRDPTALPVEIRRKAYDAYTTRTPGSFEGIRFGIPQEYFPSELSPTALEPTSRVLETLKSLGGTLVPVSLPSTPYALSAYYVIASAEASSNMARYDGVQYGLKVKPEPSALEGDASNRGKVDIRDIYAQTRSTGFGPEVRKRILLGTYALRADAFDNYFQQALRVRHLVRDDFNRVFRVPDARFEESIPVETDCNSPDIDFLVHPTAICPAPLLSEAPNSQGSLDTYVQDVLTVPASLAGLPAVSLPVSSESDSGERGDGWPMGVSIVGQWGCDETLLNVSRELAEGMS
ncbi:hypothetical protein HGRIS_005088 [Hohenbuehelia grisea]|uniref:Amidase domain-containing protein n=1 Tax=Hohenbuehelia grisea TaxID=104357 RepID=A0ABR3JES9_9AGAR